ncbi:MAG: hypothetical protein C4527_28680 [Candidatus Omnitrophota bacterium]|nr:MAG: hypothetical protein C4527_28680 [Candidatus Omnitrophota bacterium]
MILKNYTDRINWVVVFGMFFCWFSASVHACRYNVRDVGFVDLGSNAYRLYVYVDGTVSEEIVTTIRQISYAALLDSNIKTEIIAVGEQTHHPAMEYFRFWEIQTLPAAILVSPDGQSTVISILESERSLQETVWSAMDRIVTSPIREEIVEHIIQAYCVVLFIEGTNDSENQRAKKIVNGAIEEISNVMSQMPKPLDYPPYVIVISPGKFAQEKILLWSLGLRENEIGEPAVAVLHGRARRIGPLLMGDEITGSNVYHTLSVIGLSCECGLERKWMQGTTLPLIWGEKQQTEVVKILGFDAESPMVKMEISQILSLGTSGRTGARQSDDSLSAILDGYSEVTLDFGDSEALPETNDSNQTSFVSPALLHELSSASPENTTDSSPFRYLYFAIGGLVLLIMAGGGFVFIRVRKK